jgi:hypothetical protein
METRVFGALTLALLLGATPFGQAPRRSPPKVTAWPTSNTASG